MVFLASWSLHALCRMKLGSSRRLYLLRGRPGKESSALTLQSAMLMLLPRAADRVVLAPPLSGDIPPSRSAWSRILSPYNRREHVGCVVWQAVTLLPSRPTKCE